MPSGYLIDMDGVLVRGPKPIAGAAEFLQRLKSQGYAYRLFTNNSRYTPDMISQRLGHMGLDVPPDVIFTSAMATAQFLDQQNPAGSVFAVGGPGLTSALADVGYELTDNSPDYVVLGEAIEFNYDDFITALRLVSQGVRFVSTNPDVVDSTDDGPEPACGAFAAMISKATGVKPYSVGKPNPLMLRSTLRHLGIHSEQAAIIGDRMDTDIIAGIESGLETILVLSGITRRQDIANYPFRPDQIVDSVDGLLR